MATKEKHKETEAVASKEEKFPIYTAVEERKAFRRYRKTKNPELKKEIMLHYLRFVMQIARSYAISDHLTLSFEDIYQEGVIGLGRAVDLFEAKRGTRFSTYAYHWIKQAIIRYMSNNASTIRRPVHLVALRLKMLRLQKDRASEGKEPYTWDELKEILDISEETKNRLSRQDIFDVYSLNKEIGEDDHDDPTFLIDTIADPESDKGYLEVESRILEETLEEMLGKYLDQRWRNNDVLRKRNEDILRLRTGIGLGGITLTLEEVGKKHGLTRERVRQIEEKFILYLKQPTNTRKLRGFL